MEQVFCFKDMQLFNVKLYQNAKFGSARLGLTFQIENPQELQKSLKGWFVKYIQKQNFTDLYSAVTINKNTIKDRKSYCCFENIFIFRSG